MFMERVEIAAIGAVRAPLALKRAAGIAFALVTMALMPPCLAAIVIWSGMAASARFGVTVTAWRTVIHAGEPSSAGSARRSTFC